MSRGSAGDRPSCAREAIRVDRRRGRFGVTEARGRRPFPARRRGPPRRTTGLQNEDLRLRRAAATGLVRFGAAAKAALPELRKALADNDFELRLAAAEAILAIEQKGKFKEL